jgi:hypothetical protein
MKKVSPAWSAAAAFRIALTTLAAVAFLVSNGGARAVKPSRFAS